MFGQCVLSPPEVVVEESVPPAPTPVEEAPAEPVDEPTEELEGA